MLSQKKVDELVFDWYVKNEHIFNIKEYGTLKVLVELKKFVGKMLEEDRKNS